MDATPAPVDAAAEAAAASARPAIVGPAVTAWLRYFVPLQLLSVIAMAPVVVLALRMAVPVDQAGAKAGLALGWALIALGWLCQLVLVGGAAAMTGDARPSQLGGFRDGLVRLGRAVVPCLVAGATIAVASLALVVPGLVLLVVLALTGASPVRGVPASLVDSIAAVRRQLPAAVVAVAAVIAVDVAIGVIAQLSLVTIPIPRQPRPAQLAGLQQFVRAIAAALVLVSPLLAAVLATIRSRGQPVVAQDGMRSRPGPAMQIWRDPAEPGPAGSVPDLAGPRGGR